MVENRPRAGIHNPRGGPRAEPSSRDEWKGSLVYESEQSRSRTVRLLNEAGNILGRKWHPVIMFHLVENGPMRFSELQKTIDSISSKMLSEALDNLEDSDLVKRTVVKEKPLRVEYSVTPAGQSLNTVLSAMIDWARTTIPDEGAR